MEEQQQVQQQPKISYPGSMLYGMTCSILLGIFTRRAAMEPLSARPFTYLKHGVILGLALKMFDHNRRLALEQVMIAEDDAKYFGLVKAVNSARVGEEEELGNLTEYLSTSTTRV